MKPIRTVVCKICGSGFQSRIEIACYCSDPCRKIGQREYWSRYGEKRTRPDGSLQAYWAVQRAIKDGRLIAKPCELCGSTSTDAHHDDYSRPLDVLWLCRSHHREIHGRNK